MNQTRIEAWAVPLKVHDELRVEKPNGQVLLVTIGGFEMVNAPRLAGRVPVLLMANNLLKSDLPLGSTLWLTRNEATT